MVSDNLMLFFGQCILEALRQSVLTEVPNWNRWFAAKQIPPAVICGSHRWAWLKAEYLSHAVGCGPKHTVGHGLRTSTRTMPSGLHPSTPLNMAWVWFRALLRLSGEIQLWKGTPCTQYVISEIQNHFHADKEIISHNAAVIWLDDLYWFVNWITQTHSSGKIQPV